LREPDVTIDELNRQFGIPGAVVFDEGHGVLTRATITAAGGEAEVYLLGGHLTHWRCAGGEPVLWVSRESAYAISRPIRGGVPVCHPWFAERPGDPGAPQHGFVRLMEWLVESVAQGPDGDVTVVLSSRFGAGSASWPGCFELTYAITVGRTLALSLRTHSFGSEPLTLTEALHSYFRIRDVREVWITGLAGCTYFDKVAGGAKQVQDDEPVRFRGETDRVYLNAQADCVLHDPGMRRRIRVAKGGSGSTVVWNPWSDKARRTSDFGDEEWTQMVCIETANALDNAVTVPPGESHTMEARISVEPAGAA
jgi:D-hexose-6-phosphate mutarotase